MGYPNFRRRSKTFLSVFVSRPGAASQVAFAAPTFRSRRCVSIRDLFLYSALEGILSSCSTPRSLASQVALKQDASMLALLNTASAMVRRYGRSRPQPRESRCSGSGLRESARLLIADCVKLNLPSVLLLRRLDTVCAARSHFTVSAMARHRPGRPCFGIQHHHALWAYSQQFRREEFAFFLPATKKTAIAFPPVFTIGLKPPKAHDSASTLKPAFPTTQSSWSAKASPISGSIFTRRRSRWKRPL